jgi:uncharacterized protein YbbC (DUF1343 family)
MKNIQVLSWVLVALMWLQCSNNTPPDNTPASNPIPDAVKPTLGIEQLDLLLPKLQDKNVGLVVNHTSLLGKTHLADTLKARGITIKKVFAPEHGFRGAAADGETVNDGIDQKTGLPIVSLYGANKKPTAEQFADLDVVIFDIQDVGCRFYTYISTLHYVMEACAEQKKNLIVLDRPNPNGNYIDGPILEPSLKSFVGMHPIPIVHGMTIGEFALMINGERWLANGVQCEVEIIKLKNWKHSDTFSVPVRPSPNLPNDQSIKLYPSLCLFEGTEISVGRGTETPFQILGNPLLTNLPFQFTPKAIAGVSNTPPHENKLCYGIDLRKVDVKPGINLDYLLDFYSKYPNKEKFFLASFNRLAGTPVLQQQIKDGLTAQQIRDTWKEGLAKYQETRKKYLLYP